MISRLAPIAAALIVAASSSAHGRAQQQPQAGAMSVATFLAKAESLRKKGPLALMSGDLKLLTHQVHADSASLKAEREGAKAAGRPPAYCPPEGGAKMGQNEILSAMQAVPAADRSRTSTRDALRSYFARRFPCRSA